MRRQGTCRLTVPAFLMVGTGLPVYAASFGESVKAGSIQRLSSGVYWQDMRQYVALPFMLPGSRRCLLTGRQLPGGSHQSVGVGTQVGTGG
jgi:hypothetical protein